MNVKRVVDSGNKAVSAPGASTPTMGNTCFQIVPNYGD